MVREIHIANSYFTNAVAAKVRPVLLLKPNSFNDILYLPLASNTTSYGVRIDNNDLQNVFLPKTSVIIYEKPGVIAPSLLVKKIGTLHVNTYNYVISELIRFLQK